MVNTRVQSLERETTMLVGLSVTVSLNEDLENGVIVQLREGLVESLHRIPNRVGDGIYLVQIYPDGEWTPDVPFQSIVAVEVHAMGKLPTGFTQHTLPAGVYAKVIHTGPESQIGETYDFIQSQDIASARPFDFEYWTDVHSVDEEASVIDIYLPLEAQESS
ncbi:hypothetical protein JCM10914A_22700 [Paenibacillus sp. JCM 10914]